MPRSLTHVLLSLLLLITQQLSLAHGYTHWSEVSERIGLTQVQAQAGASNDGGKPSKPGLHDLCGQCQASAQIAYALPNTLRQFVPAELAYAVPSLPETPGICLLAACPFQPRGPPQAG
ncbi:hypothetical protein QPK32_20770 [Massilia sp. YIM B02763]|uniref:DUF2946 family protein n=1 Tax=Massilia sp. YIM B02763 TaxID=3050130 RepID=UPI0025B70B05|nr:hypothetical protein [Massilia sp. YIM B02763]MDN4055505.1 hypothetical protein [Massilia sp. YIM B02763]